MKPESTFERIRKVRKQISEECGHDPKRLVEYYMKLQAEFRDRLVESPEQELDVPEPVQDFGK